MSILQFIASLVSSLVWPVALIVVIVMLRAYIPALLKSLRKVKLSGFELELERTRIDVEVALSSADESSTSAAPTSSLPVDPDAAAGVIIRLFAKVEKEIRVQLAKAGVDDLDGKSASQLVGIGVSEGVFTEEAANAVRGIAVLRNLAAHGRADELTPDKVAEYAVLVEATIFTIQQRPRRRSGDRPRGGDAV